MTHLLARQPSSSEILRAVELALPHSHAGRLDSSQQAKEFLRYLSEQKLNLDWKYVIEQDNQICGSCLGIVSPGRTAMVLLSDSPKDTALCRGLAGALETLRKLARRSNLTMLQALIPQDRAGQAQALTLAGFKYLADLRYLTLMLDLSSKRRPCNRDLAIESYSPENAALFHATLEMTYCGSLDCPQLNGLRTIDDIILGHQHTGIHDPALWKLARIGDRPIGVLLLTQVPLRSAMEIVYVGVVPEARSNSYGRQLVNIAIESSLRAKKELLMLAVDQRNHYAMDVYKSEGFLETDRRDAWYADLSE